MTPLERLRHAIALAHTISGTELRLHTANGEQVVVSRHPAADIDPCRMHRIVAASILPGQPDIAAKVVSVDVGGALSDLGGGVMATCADGKAQRWITSTLSSDRVADLLDGVGLDLVPEDAMSATLKPDVELGVTLVVITSNDVAWNHALDAVAEEAAAACFVEELHRDIVPSGVRHHNVSGGRS